MFAVTRADGGASVQRGLAWAVVSAAAFGLSGSLATGLLRTGWSPGAIVLVRVALAVVVLAVPAVVQQRRTGRLSRPQAWRIALFGLVAVCCAQLCFFSAVGHLSVGVALMLEYSGTMLVVGWEWARTKRQPPLRTFAGGASALAGLSLALGIWSGLHVDVVGLGWGLGAAVGLAFYFVLSAREEDAPPPLVTAAGGLAIGALALAVAGLFGALPLRAARTPVVLAGEKVGWMVPVLGLALVTGALAYATGVVAAQRLGATLSSFVGLAEILVAIVAAWALLDQRLGVTQLFGSALVLAGIALVRMDAGAKGADRAAPEDTLVAA